MCLRSFTVCWGNLVTPTIFTNIWTFPRHRLRHLPHYLYDLRHPFSPNPAWTPVTASCVEEKVGIVLTPALHAAPGCSRSESSFTLPSSLHLVSLYTNVSCSQSAPTKRGNKQNKGTFLFHLKHDKWSPVSKCHFAVYIKLLPLWCFPKSAVAENSSSSRGFLEFFFRKIYSKNTLF